MLGGRFHQLDVQRTPGLIGAVELILGGLRLQVAVSRVVALLQKGDGGEHGFTHLLIGRLHLRRLRVALFLLLRQPLPGGEVGVGRRRRLPRLLQQRRHRRQRFRVLLILQETDRHAVDGDAGFDQGFYGIAQVRLLQRQLLSGHEVFIGFCHAVVEQETGQGE